jgi:diguanylate cyclase (GGDEF)-like protein/PAS domain S-box-containing protein
MRVAVRTERFTLLMAVVEFSFGMGVHMLPGKFTTSLYAPLVPYFRLFSAAMISGGILLLLQARFKMAVWYRRLLFLFPAAIMAWLGAAYAAGGAWLLVEPAAFLSVGLLLVPWLPQGGTLPLRAVHWCTAVTGATIGVWGAIMLAWPGSVAGVFFAPIQPFRVWLGFLGLLGGTTLFLPPLGGRWTSMEESWRWLPSTTFVVGFAMRFMQSEFWTGIVIFVAWTVVLLTSIGGLDPVIDRLEEKGAEASPDNTGALLVTNVRYLEVLSWMLVLVAVAASAVGLPGAVVSPLLNSLFILALVSFNVLVGWLLAPLLRPERRLYLQMIWYLVAVGILNLDRGYLGDVIGVVPFLMALTAARDLSERSGLVGLGVGLATVLLSEAGQGILYDYSPGQMLGRAAIKTVLLLVIGAVSLKEVGRRRAVDRTLAQVRQNLQDNVKHLATVHRVSSSIYRSLDTDDVLNTAVVEMGKALHVSRCFVSVRTGDYFPVTHEHAAPGQDPGLSLHDDMPLEPGCLVDLHGVLAIDDLSAMPKGAFSALLERHRVASLMVMPIRVEGEFLGVLGVFQCCSPRRWQSEEVSLLESVSAQVAVALSHASAHRDLALREELMRQSEAVFRSAFDDAPIGVALVDQEGMWLRVNTALCDMFGYTSDELIDRPAWEVVDAGYLYRMQRDALLATEGKSVAARSEIRLQRKDGREIWVLGNASLVRDSHGDPLYYVCQVQDITERKRAEARLAYAATHDELTDLLNRRGFQRELDSLLRSVPSNGGRGALLFLDLDQFKYVNDSLGHRAGDELLCSVAGVLRQLSGETGVLARIGGDEFALALPGADADAAEAAARLVLHAMEGHSILVGGQLVSASVSVGVALYPEHGSTGESLMARVDVAMYQAKERGRNQYCLSEGDGAEQARVEAKLVWERRIRDALDHDRFVLYCQPILDLRRGEVTRYELLLRMVGEDGALVEPGAFLDVAERFGLIRSIDRWVVRQAIGLVSRSVQAGNPVCVAINLSASSLKNAELLELIQRELSAACIDPGLLTLEITESAAVADMGSAARFIETLRGMGCQFALDDFGNGYLSFNHLKHLGVDFLKVDGSLIRNLTSDERDQHLVRSIAEMARALGKAVIAEFVEEESTVELLRSYGVQYAQGYHIGRPAPLSAMLPGVVQHPAAD